MWIWVEHGTKYREKDWTNSDLRGVQIYEEEWTGWMKSLEWEQTSVNMAKRDWENREWGMRRVRRVERVEMV